MFERYTEKSRRVIFFARYEASQFGSPYIETEHLLLGLLREHKALANRFLGSHAAVDSIRKKIEQQTGVREKMPTSVDLPLSHECKRILGFGAEEAERLGHKHIGAEHLLIGLLREEKCFAAELLRERGLELALVREELKSEPPEASTVTPLTVSHMPQVFNLPAETQAEISRQAQARGIDVKSYLLSLIQSALNPTPGEAESGTAQAGQKETYDRLRKQMVAEGFPSLNAAELKEEIARRKGWRR